MLKGRRLGDPCGMLETLMIEQPNFSGFGALAGARSASALEVANMLDFKEKGNELFVSRNALGEPSVKIKYMLDQNVTPRTSFSCAVGTKAGLSETTVTLNKFLMGGYEFKSGEYDQHCADYLNYLKSEFAEVGNPNFGTSSNAFLQKFQGLGQFKVNFLKSSKSTLIKPLNDYVITKLTPGLNPVTGLSTPTTTAFKNSSGMIVTDFLEQLLQLRMKTGYTGKYIVYGGIKVAPFMAEACGLPKGIFCCSQLGINGQAVLDAMQNEFYYDGQIDAVYGPGTIIVQEQGAMALMTFEDLRPDSDWCCESYGNMNMNVAVNCESNISLPLQTFSSKEGLCANLGMGTSLKVYWTLKYDVYTRPFNFTDGSADKGIYHFVMQ